MPLTLDKSFDPTKTITSRYQRTDFIPSGGSVVKISSKMIDVDSRLITALLKQPAGGDINRDVAEVAIEAEETVLLVDVEEIEAIWTALGGINGLVLGTAKHYVKDPRDASAAVCKLSITGAAAAAYSCSIKRPDGAVRIGGQDFSKTSLLVRNLSGAALVVNLDPASPDGSA